MDIRAERRAKGSLGAAPGFVLRPLERALLEEKNDQQNDQDHQQTHGDGAQLLVGAFNLPTILAAALTLTLLILPVVLFMIDLEHHILPNVMPALLVQATLTIATAVIEYWIAMTL